MRIAITVCAALLFGCGGAPRRSPSETGTPPPVSPATPTATDPSQPVTEDECLALIDHAMGLAVGEMPASERPDPASQKEVRDKLVAELLPACLEDVSRAQLECGLAATTSAALTACDS